MLSVSCVEIPGWNLGIHKCQSSSSERAVRVDTIYLQPVDKIMKSVIKV